jgi:hypothetical protein
VPETGLVVVGNNGKPVDSIYQLANNGLFLPPMPVSMAELKQAQSNMYPEFAKEVVLTLSQQFIKPSFLSPKYYKVPTEMLLTPHIPRQKELHDIIPNLQTHNLINCPGLCDVTHTTVQGAIMHLNDDHHWTREKIANWCDGLPIDLKIRKVA